MKTTLINLLIAVFFFSCSGNKEEKKEATDQSSISEMMKENPPYDVTKIDPNAKVVEIKLKAQGNTMTDMHFDQTELHVAAGTTVKLTLINEGTDAAMEHNFVLIENGMADSVAKSGLQAGPDNQYIPRMPQVLTGTQMTKPKSETQITFPAPEKGTYEFICTYPGHYQKMRGKFIVE